MLHDIYINITIMQRYKIIMIDKEIRHSFLLLDLYLIHNHLL